jgi:protein SCO1/2
LTSAVGLGVALVVIQPAEGHSLKQLEDRMRARERYVEIVDRPAPDFALQDPKGRRVALADFRGKVVVLNFIYTHCPDVCPLHSEKIVEIQEKVNRTPMRDLVRFVTITTDPASDTPEIMNSYSRTHGLSPVNWVFLTSSAETPEQTRSIAKSFGLKFTLAKDGYQMHGLVTHLIDKSGNLRARYHGLKFDPTNMVVHINALTNDDH